MGFRGFPGGAMGKEPACQCRRRKRHAFDPWVGKVPMATHSSVLAWRIPRTEEPRGLQSIVEQGWTRLKQLSTCTWISELRRQSPSWFPSCCPCATIQLGGRASRQAQGTSSQAAATEQSVSAGQGECPAHVAGMLGVQTRQHHGSTLLSVTPRPPHPCHQHTMSCCLQGCSEFQLLPWDPGVGPGGAGRCGPAGVTCPPPSVYPSVIDPHPFGTSAFHSQTLGTLWECGWPWTK